MKFWDEPRQICFNYLGTVCSINYNKDERSFHMDILDDIEVIGNIHEIKDK